MFLPARVRGGARSCHFAYLACIFPVTRESHTCRTRAGLPRKIPRYLIGWSVFLNPAKQAEYDIQKKKESEINQQQQKEFEKVAKKYARKNNNRANKSQLDKNFAETGKYESDKSRKSREKNELKKANNYKRKNGWFGYQHLGDWNDK